MHVESISAVSFCLTTSSSFRNVTLWGFYTECLALYAQRKSSGTETLQIVCVILVVSNRVISGSCFTHWHGTPMCKTPIREGYNTYATHYLVNTTVKERSHLVVLPR